MATKGIDCAQPLTYEKAVAIRQQGYVFAARYLVPLRYTWKRLTRQEAEAITKAGMKIVSVFETTANRAAYGAEAGKEDGKTAYTEAQAVGQPKGSVIYFAVDFDARQEHYDAIEKYLRAAKQEIPGYALGVYGSYGVVEAMSKRIPGIALWQTYGWSYGKKFDANIYQYKNGVTVAGHPVDLNESYGGEGWWDLSEKKEEAKPGMNLKDWQWDMLEDNVEYMLKKKWITDEKWLDKVRTRTITADELVWLVAVAMARRG